MSKSAPDFIASCLNYNQNSVLLFVEDVVHYLKMETKQQRLCAQLLWRILRCVKLLKVTDTRYANSAISSAFHWHHFQYYVGLTLFCEVSFSAKGIKSISNIVFSFQIALCVRIYCIILALINTLLSALPEYEAQTELQSDITQVHILHNILFTIWPALKTKWVENRSFCHEVKLCAFFLCVCVCVCALSLYESMKNINVIMKTKYLTQEKESFALSQENSLHYIYTVVRKVGIQFFLLSFLMKRKCVSDLNW